MLLSFIPLEVTYLSVFLLAHCVSFFLSLSENYIILSPLKKLNALQLNTEKNCLSNIKLYENCICGVCPVMAISHMPVITRYRSQEVMNVHVSPHAQRKNDSSKLDDYPDFLYSAGSTKTASRQSGTHSLELTEPKLVNRGFNLDFSLLIEHYCGGTHNLFKVMKWGTVALTQIPNAFHYKSCRSTDL